MYGDNAPAVWLDKNPPNNEHVNIYYYAQLSRMEEGNFSIPIFSSTNHSGGSSADGTLLLGTDLGPVLDGATFAIGGIYSVAQTSTLVFHKIDAQLRQNQSTNFIYDPTVTTPHKYSGAFSYYKHTMMNITTQYSKTVQIDNYRQYAPMIPQMYRISLCNYAIALSQAKSNPQMHDKHLALFLQDVEKIKNESADKDLNHTIKEVV